MLNLVSGFQVRSNIFNVLCSAEAEGQRVLLKWVTWKLQFVIRQIQHNNTLTWEIGVGDGFGKVLYPAEPLFPSVSSKVNAPGTCQECLQNSIMEHTMIQLIRRRRRRSQTDKNIRTWVKVPKLRAEYNKLRGSDQQPEMRRCVMGRATSAIQIRMIEELQLLESSCNKHIGSASPAADNEVVESMLETGTLRNGWQWYYDNFLYSGPLELCRAV